MRCFMKSHVKIAGMLLCASVLISGCSEGGVRRDESTEETTVTSATTTETANKPVAAPSDVQFEYSKADKNVRFFWTACDNAVKYEVSNGSVTTEFTKPECYLNDVEEGMGGSLFIRSVGADGVMSEWTQADYFIEVHLDAPAKVYMTPDGGRMYLYWDQVDGATGYEVNFYEADGSTTPLTITYPYRSFRSPIVDGTQKRFDIRSVKTVNNQNYYSDWQSFNYTDPTFKDLKDYNFYESCTLDFDRLKKWAKAKGYTFKSTVDGDYTFVEISFKDDVNSKFWAKIKRAVGDAFKAAIRGYEEGINLENAVEAFSESEKKWKTDFFDKLNAIAEKDAEKSGLFAGIKSFATPRTVNCYYRFSNTNTAPDGCEVALDKKNRKTYATDFAAQHKPDSNGIYTFVVEGSEQYYYMMINENDHYWCVDLVPQHFKEN